MNPAKDAYRVLEKKDFGGPYSYLLVESASTGARYLFEEVNWSLRPKERLIHALMKKLENRIAEMSAIEHPAFVKYVSFEKIGDSYGLLAQCLEGRILQSYVQETEVNPETAVKWALTLLELIDELRTKNKSLKGISDQNTIILSNGEIAVFDNDIALELSTYRGQNKHFANFVAPETIYGGEWDAASDLFSLGVLFYRLLTGVLPFNDPEPEKISDNIMHKEPEEPRLVNPAIGKNLSEAVTMMLAKDRKSRISALPEIIERLKAIREKGDYYSDEKEQALLKAKARKKRIGEILYMPVAFFLKHWKLISAAAVALAIIIFIFSSGRYVERVTPDTTASELVSLHYKALEELDDRLMKETLAKGVGSQRVDMVSRLYVIEKMNQLNNRGTVQEEIDLLKLSDLEIRTVTEPAEGSDSPTVFEAEYLRTLKPANAGFFRKERVKDTLKLERVKGEWKIVELKEEILSEETAEDDKPKGKPDQNPSISED